MFGFIADVIGSTVDAACEVVGSTVDFAGNVVDTAIDTVGSIEIMSQRTQVKLCSLQGQQLLLGAQL